QDVDEPLAMTRGGVTSFFEQDGISSITSLSNSAGAITDTYSYDAYGNLTASNGTTTNPIRYTGGQFDSETGLYHPYARYYDPSTGRFLSEDPVGFGGGINFYDYVRNNPINRTDPLGLWPITGGGVGVLDWPWLPGEGGAAWEWVSGIGRT